MPKYAPISHVWKPSLEVEKISKDADRPLKIQIRNDELHEISWHGLVQAGHAAKHLGCNHLWLDLLCLDQVPSTDREKEMQVKNMGNIYEKAAAVIIMVGGVAAAQGIDKVTSWIDRAWTLQEATLCPNTHVLVEWPFEEEVSVTQVLSGPMDMDAKVFHARFEKLVDNLAIIPFERLLQFPDLTTSNIILSPGFRMKCLGGSEFQTAARSSLLAVIKAENPEMRQCGAWRSM